MISSEYGIETFGQLIADAIRTDAYAEALRAAIRPGAVVVDLGTGTGIFALLACRFGAARVHAIESDPIVLTAARIAQANGFADRIRFHHALSTAIDLPEKADVIVSDIYGVTPLHRRRLEVLIDARRRFLAPGGAMIPRRDRLWIALVSAPELHRPVAEPWKRNKYGLDMSAAVPLAANLWRRVRIDASQLASLATPCAVLDYSTLETTRLDVELRVAVTRAAAVHGFCLWFDAELGEGSGFSNAPGKPEVIYGNAFFRWADAHDLRAGEVVSLHLRADPVGDHYVWTWETSFQDAGDRPRATLRQSTFFGVPVSPEGLRTLSADHAPGLGVEGAVDLAILEALQDGLTLGQAAARVAARFPGRFARDEDAVRHVAELSARYAR